MREQTIRQVEYAKIQILRYLQEIKPEPGSKLPSHDEMRKLIGCGGSTLNSALRELQREGILDLRDKVGTFFRNSPAQSVSFSRIVGVLRLPVAESFFKAYYEHYLQLELIRQGCNAIFFGDEDANLFEFRSSAYFINCLKAHHFDALIDLCHVSGDVHRRIMKSGIPFVLGVGPDAGRHGVMPNYEQVLSQAIRHLKQIGCTRLAFLVNPGGHLEFNRAYFEVWSREVAPVTLESHENQIFFYNDMMGGCRFAREIMSRAPGERPDGVIFLDDSSALAFAGTLCGEFPSEPAPKFTTVCLKQQHFYWPRKPELFFEFDVEFFARLIVNYLMEYLRTGTPPPNQYYDLPALAPMELT